MDVPSVRDVPSVLDVLAEAQTFDPTLALQRITHCDLICLGAETCVATPALLLEALAQACGMHVRFCHAFAVQAYVASMTNVRCPLNSSADVCHIYVSLLARTASACTYAVRMDQSAAGHITMGYTPLSATDPLQRHFQARFDELCTHSTNA